MLYEDKLRRILEQQNESRENRVAKNPLDGDNDSVDSSDDDISTDELRKEELKAGVKEARRQRKLRESNMELEKGDFFAMLISAYGVFIPIALVILGIICAVVILMFGRG